MDSLSKASGDGYLTAPKKLIVDTWKNNKEQGSSTLVVVTLPKDGSKLYSSFVGDSGYCILRETPAGSYNYTVEFESTPQQRSFNFPLQLGWGKNGDHPDVAAEKVHDIKHNDIVVLGSDGLYDNVSASRVAGMVSKYMEAAKGQFDAVKIAEEIAKQAFQLSLSKTHNSPFAIEAKRSGYNFKGGKSDDITVVVGKVRLITGRSDL